MTGKDFSHRRDWIRQRLFELADAFAVEICGYAIMSNHFHLVLTVRQDRALQWSDREVAERWLKLFRGPPLVRNWLTGSPQSEAQQNAARGKVAEYRARLHDLSWFMRCLNEPIARMANHEDNVTGRFWEGRFKSQALLDEAALITAMAYVDLNPIRAGIAETPEQSAFTSIQQRVIEEELAADPEATTQLPNDLASAIGKLVPFSPEPGLRPDHTLPVTLAAYLQLVDWTGRAIVHGKKGVINDRAPPILKRLKANADGVLGFLATAQSRRSPNALGSIERLRDVAGAFGRKFLRGQNVAATLFG